MFAQRQALRALRMPMIQRRLASSAPKAGENAFVAERRAVKEHAAQSSGESLSEPRPNDAWLLEGDNADESTALWKKISMYDITPP